MKPRYADRAHLLLFARAPQAGRVKTRLASEVGPDVALAVYERLLAATVGCIAAWPSADLRLVVTPDEAVPWFRERFGPHPVDPQGDGDLGVRIVRAMSAAHCRWPQPLVAVGADAPDLPRDTYLAGLAAAARGAVALAPTSDGGYALIATPHPAPRLFREIAWGTPRVAGQTRAAARGSGLALEVLPAWRDVDTLGDVHALLARLAARSEPALVKLQDGLLSLKLPAAAGSG